MVAASHRGDRFLSDEKGADDIFATGGRQCLSPFYLIFQEENIMKLLSRVCAEFTDGKGKVIYRIRPNDRLVYKDDAPEAIRGDLLFRMLAADGSIEVIETVEQRKKLESDPTAGTTAEGKKMDAQAVSGTQAETKQTKPARQGKNEQAAPAGPEDKSSAK